MPEIKLKDVPEELSFIYKLEKGQRAYVDDLDDEIYHGPIGISNSGLKHLSKSPMHFKYYVLDQNEKKDTKALQFGKILHKAVLEPDMFAKTYISKEEISGDKRRKAYKEAVHDLQAAHPGKEVIPWEWFQDCSNMADQVYAHPHARELLNNGVRERACYGLDEIINDYPVILKAKADYFRSDGIIIDLKKTANDARLSSFEKTVYNYGYFVQAYWYMKVFGAQEFYFIAVEDTPPHGVCAYRATEAIVEAGQHRAEHYLRQFKECIANDRWPGYQQSDIEPVGFPHWAWTVEEEFENSLTKGGSVQ